MGTLKIFIIKFGAIGDVIRTTPLLLHIKKKYPDSKITWLTVLASREILETISEIDRIIYYEKGLELNEEYDIVFSLDKEMAALEVAMRVKSKDKRGFGLGEDGKLAALNPDAQYAVRLGIDDQLKFFDNKKTYQEYTAQSVGLEFEGEEYIINLKPSEIAFAKKFMEKSKPIKPIIGLNTGTGKVYQTKQWPLEYFIEIGKLLLSEGFGVIVLGGPSEEEQNDKIIQSLGFRAINGTCKKEPKDGEISTLREFAAVLANCDAIVTSDTLAMHLAIGKKVPAIVLFGSTCPQEIDLYGRGMKLFLGVYCSPCYKHLCDKLESEHMACMRGIEPKKVLLGLKQILAEFNGKK